MIDTVGTGGTPFFATGGNTDGGAGGSWIWAIVLVCLLGGGFGGRGRGDDCAREAVDNAEINSRLDNINAMAEQRANLKEVCDSHMATLESKGDIIREVIEGKYDTSLQLKDLQAANAAC